MSKETCVIHIFTECLNLISSLFIASKILFWYLKNSNKTSDGLLSVPADHEDGSNGFRNFVYQAVCGRLFLFSVMWRLYNARDHCDLVFHNLSTYKVNLWSCKRTLDRKKNLVKIQDAMEQGARPLFLLMKKFLFLTPVQHGAAKDLAEAPQQDLGTPGMSHAARSPSRSY